MLSFLLPDVRNLALGKLRLVASSDNRLLNLLRGDSLFCRVAGFFFA
jgi:hypothetical protein